MFACQGGWEDDETVEEAACREALEEAGVKGILNVCPFSCLIIAIVAIVDVHMYSIT